MGNPYGNLYDKITDDQKYPVTTKSIVNDNIYPRTTHRMLTLYYSSYIDIVQGTNTYLLEYYTTSETPYATIIISISKASTPQLKLSIKYTSGSSYKDYVVTQDQPKVVIDLTADLAVATPGKKLYFLNLRSPISPG
jgi:hypothetical protein